MRRTGGAVIFVAQGNGEPVGCVLHGNVQFIRTNLTSADPEGQTASHRLFVVERGFGGADKADFVQAVVRAIANTTGLTNQSVGSTANVAHGDLAEFARQVNLRVAIGGAGAAGTYDNEDVVSVSEDTVGSSSQESSTAAAVAADLVEAHGCTERQAAVSGARHRCLNTNTRREGSVSTVIDHAHASGARQSDRRVRLGCRHSGGQNKCGRSNKNLFHFFPR